MSRTQLAIIISVVVLSSGILVYFNTHQRSFTPAVVHLSSPSYPPSIQQVKLDSSMASDLSDSTKSAKKK